MKESHSSQVVVYILNHLADEIILEFLIHTISVSSQKDIVRAFMQTQLASVHRLWAYVNTLYGLNIGKQPYHLQHQALHLTCSFFISFSQRILDGC